MELTTWSWEHRYFYYGTYFTDAFFSQKSQSSCFYPSFLNNLICISRYTSLMHTLFRYRNIQLSPGILYWSFHWQLFSVIFWKLKWKIQHIINLKHYSKDRPNSTIQLITSLYFKTKMEKKNWMFQEAHKYVIESKF